LNTLIIENLSVQTLVGCLDWEQTQTQELLIDLRMDLSHSGPCLIDHLSEYVDYAAVAENVRSVCKNHHTQMIERLAEIIASHLLSKFPIAKITVKLCKPHFIPEVGKASIEITRFK
jgi:dihydroneopterin aldolase